MQSGIGRDRLTAKIATTKEFQKLGSSVKPQKMSSQSGSDEGEELVEKVGKIWAWIEAVVRVVDRVIPHRRLGCGRTDMTVWLLMSRSAYRRYLE